MKLHRTPGHGDAIDASESMYPSRLRVLADGRNEVGSPSSTTYGYVIEGWAFLECDGLETLGKAGTFFCIPGAAKIKIDQGAVVLFERIGFRGILSVGRIEAEGRLSYINGCSDSILVMPPRLGDPVLNHLHFPANVDQTQHEHPSLRLGVVARGSGLAHGPGWEEPLEEGCVFMIPAREVHSFRTKTSPMDVIAYHPDSDWGPTDALHPMLNRTYLR